MSACYTNIRKVRLAHIERTFEKEKNMSATVANEYPTLPPGYYVLYGQWMYATARDERFSPEKRAYIALPQGYALFEGSYSLYGIRRFSFPLSRRAFLFRKGDISWVKRSVIAPDHEEVQVKLA